MERSIQSHGNDSTRYAKSRFFICPWANYSHYKVKRLARDLVSRALEVGRESSRGDEIKDNDKSFRVPPVVRKAKVVQVKDLLARESVILKNPPIHLPFSLF